MTNIRLDPFDRNRDFVALREFMCNGINLAKGDPFDKNSVPTRRLRLMYECRAIGYSDGQAPVTKRKPKLRTITPFSDMPLAPAPMTAEAREAMIHGNSKQVLVNMAREEYGLDIPDNSRLTKAELVDAIEASRHAAPRA